MGFTCVTEDKRETKIKCEWDAINSEDTAQKWKRKGSAFIIGFDEDMEDMESLRQILLFQSSLNQPL